MAGVLSVVPVDAWRSEGTGAAATPFAFRVLRSGDIAATATADWSAVGMSGWLGLWAADAADFGATFGTVSFAPGQASVTFSVPVLADARYEPDEGFAVVLSNPSAGASIELPVAAGGITNDDEVSIGIWADNGYVTEGSGGTTSYSFSLERNSANYTGGIGVAWRVVPAVAPEGAPASAADFAGGVFPSGVVTFAQGQTRLTLNVPVLADTLDEGAELFAVQLFDPFGGAGIDTPSALGIILDDDETAFLSIAEADPWKQEGNGGSAVATFTVRRSGDVSRAHTVAWSVEGDLANPASAADFVGGVFPSGVVSFAPGVAQQTIAVPIAGDMVVEPSEGFRVALSNPSDGAEIKAAGTWGTILDDDGPAGGSGVLSIAATQASQAEGQGGSTGFTFTVTRGGSAAGPAMANWAVGGKGVDAADFAGGLVPSGVVSFAAGETSRVIAVPVAGDAVVEGDEAFTVTLSNPLAGVTLGTAVASGTIRNDDAVLALGGVVTAVAEGKTGTATASFTVTRSGDVSRAHSVAWTVQAVGLGSSTATAADFPGGVIPSGIVSFAPGETQRGISVPIAGDTVAEANETFVVVLSAPSEGATLGAGVLTGSIIDDDTPGSGSLAISANEADQPEGTGGFSYCYFRVTRSGDTSLPAQARWSVAGGGAPAANVAIAADFGGMLPAGVVSFAAGETNAWIVVPVATDNVVETDDGFTVTLSNASPGVTLGTAKAWGRIRNDDAQFSVGGTGFDVSEGDRGTVTATFSLVRTGDLSVAHEVSWSVAGVGDTPADAADFAGGVLPAGRVTFAPGQATRPVTVAVAGDRMVEATFESFRLVLSDASGGATIGSGSPVVRILADDAAGSGTLSIARLYAERAEGGSGATDFTYLVTRTGWTGLGAVADWAVGKGTLAGTVPAVAADFAGGVLPSGVVSFAPGEASRTITVRVAGDAAVELNESFTVALSNPGQGVSIGTASATGLIWDDDALGSGALSIARAAAQQAEGNGGTTAFTFTVARSGDLSRGAGADWVVSGGGVAGTVPAEGADFVAGALPRGHVVFAPGQGRASVVVPVAGDGAIELNESFTVSLVAPQAGVSLGVASATGAILNDDFIPSGVLSIAPLQASRGEGTGGSTAFTFAVTRSGSTMGPARAIWEVITTGFPGTSNADFGGGPLLPSGVVSFAPGETRQVVTVAVTGDAAAEGDEGFTVRLSGTPDGVTLGVATASGTIWNDDTAGSGTVSLAKGLVQGAEGLSGTATLTFSVLRTGAQLGAAVDWSVAAGGAVTGTLAADAADFAGALLPSGRLTFAPGETQRSIAVPVAADMAQEFNEAFTVTLSNPQMGVSLGTASASGVILNDDFVSTAKNEFQAGSANQDLFLLGGGLDTIYGRGGADLFRVLPAALGPVAQSLTALEDLDRALGEVIDLSAIDAVAGTAQNDAFAFIGTAAFGGVAGQLRWQAEGAVQRVQGDVNGDCIADLTLLVRAPGPVAADWFVL